MLNGLSIVDVKTIMLNSSSLGNVTLDPTTKNICNSIFFNLLSKT